MTPTTTVNVTLTGVTPAQFEAITNLLTGSTKTTKKSKPQKTVSDDEDEDFGKKAMKRKDLDDDAEEEELEASDEETDDEETDTETEDSDEDEDTEPSVTFQEVRAALNKYGEKHPDQARAILLGFNIKSPKELAAKGNQRYWEPVYRKVMAKIKASKKKK